MKKISLLIVALIFLCSCQKQELVSITEYYPTYNSIDIKPGIIFTNVAISLEDYNNVTSITSNYDGLTANLYEYDNFEIETYYDESNIEKIYSVRLTSENQTTNEGLKIGDSIDNMLNTYGTNYTNPVSNIYLYNLANSNLSFTIEDSKVSEIIYYLT